MAFRNEVINGTDFALKIEDIIVGCATSHTIEITNSPREVACKDSGGWDYNEYGRYSWSGSVDALVNFDHDPLAVADDDKRQGYNDVLALMIAGTKVEVISEYDMDGAGTDVFRLTGDAVITSISKNAAHGDNTSYSLSFVGTGELTRTRVES